MQIKKQFGSKLSKLLLLKCRIEAYHFYRSVATNVVPYINIESNKKER